MSPYFLHYLESNAVCLVIFGIMLAHDLLKQDRQEKQIKYDWTLVAFMGYFITDTIWAGVIDGVIPNDVALVCALNFANFILMAAITFSWLRYAMAVEQVQGRDKPIKIFAILFPFIASLVALIVIFAVAPELLINAEKNKTQPLFNVFLVTAPIIYIVASLIYSLRRVKGEKSAEEKRKHIYIGCFPLIVILGGLAQMLLLPEGALFCSCCTIFMLVFYIQAMEKQISVDPLTGLNNRGQLTRYIAQGAHKDATTYILMIDINDFKRINDTFGHAEGDRALVIVADALKRIVNARNFPTFLGRYGGDEFILIAHTQSAPEIDRMINEIREGIAEDCFLQQTPYVIFVGIGFDQIGGEADTFQKCITRADDNLYIDKKNCKLNNQTTMLK